MLQRWTLVFVLNSASSVPCIFCWFELFSKIPNFLYSELSEFSQWNCEFSELSEKFGHQVAPIVLVLNLATKWRYLHQFLIWSPGDATCISGASCNGSKFGHQVAPLALVPNLATKWRHLHQFLIWSPGGATCIVPKFGPNMLFAVCTHCCCCWLLQMGQAKTMSDSLTERQSDS